MKMKKSAAADTDVIIQKKSVLPNVKPEYFDGVINKGKTAVTATKKKDAAMPIILNVFFSCNRRFSL